MNLAARRPLPLAVTVITAIGLVAIAVIHLDIAKNYLEVGTKPLSLGDQFYAQAAAGIVLAVALLATAVRSLGRYEPLLWLATLGFGVLSLGFLIVSRYHTIPVPGLPGGFQESWSVKGARPAAYAETVTIIAAAYGAAIAARRYRRRATV